jgi:hypothetical protein
MSNENSENKNPANQESEQERQERLEAELEAKLSELSSFSLSSKTYHQDDPALKEEAFRIMEERERLIEKLTRPYDPVTEHILTERGRKLIEQFLGPLHKSPFLAPQEVARAYQRVAEDMEDEQAEDLFRADPRFVNGEPVVPLERLRAKLARWEHLRDWDPAALLPPGFSTRIELRNPFEDWRVSPMDLLEELYGDVLPEDRPKWLPELLDFTKQNPTKRNTYLALMSLQDLYTELEHQVARVLSADYRLLKIADKLDEAMQYWFPFQYIEYQAYYKNLGVVLLPEEKFWLMGSWFVGNMKVFMQQATPIIAGYSKARDKDSYFSYMATWYCYKYNQVRDLLVIFYDKSAKIFAGKQRLSELAAAGETREVKELRRQIEEATRRAEKAEKEAQALRAQIARAEERARQAEKSAAQARQQERTGSVPDAQMRHYIRQMVQEELRRAMLSAQGFPVEDEPLEETSGGDLLNLVREETGDEYWQEEDEEDEEEPELEASPEDETRAGEELAGEPEDGGWNLDSIPDSAPTLSEVPPPGHLPEDLRSAFYDRDGNLTWRGRVFYAVAATGACSTGVLWPRVDRNQAGEAVRWLMQEMGLLEEIDPGARSILGSKLFRLSKRGAGVAGGWLQRKLAPCLWDELLRRHNNPAHAMLVLETGGLCNRLEGVLEVDLTPKSLGGYTPDLRLRVLHRGEERELYVEAERNTDKRLEHFLEKLDRNLEANGGILCFAVEKPGDWDGIVAKGVRPWLRERGRDSVRAIIISLKTGSHTAPTWSDWIWETTAKIWPRP